MWPADDLPECIFGGNRRAVGVGVKQQQGLEVAPEALGDHVLPSRSHLYKTTGSKTKPVSNLLPKKAGAEIICILKMFNDIQMLASRSTVCCII